MVVVLAIVVMKLAKKDIKHPSNALLEYDENKRNTVTTNPVKYKTGNPNLFKHPVCMMLHGLGVELVSILAVLVLILVLC